MNRPLIYTGEIIRTFDIASAWRDALEALAQLTEDLLGGSTAVAAGLAATQQSPESLSINIAPGSLYLLTTVDPTAAGALPASADIAMVQGILAAQTALLLSTSGLGAGQNRYALIEATVVFNDGVRVGDPSGGVLPFYNSQNPAQPLQGQGGSGGVLNTERFAIVQFQIIYGAPAATGSEAPPNPDTNYVPLFLIDLTFGQTQISQGEILVAGPSVGTGVPNNYPQAPFLAGLLNSHHGGLAGQAPQVRLAAAGGNPQEVQGILPLANLPVTNTVGGAVIPVIRVGAATPSGNVAGNTNDLYWSTGSGSLYVCTASGTASTAVWTIAVTVAGAAPTGAAGGALNGSFPNPGIIKVPDGAGGGGVTVDPATAAAAGKVIQASSSSAAAWATLPTPNALAGALNLRGDPDGSNPTTTFDITADQLILRVPGTGLAILITAFAANVIINGSQSGSQANGRDQAGNFSANTFVHLYAIGGNANTPALLLSNTAPPTGPTLPGTYSAWTFLGTFRLGGTALFTAQRLRGSKIYYDAQQTTPLVAGTATTETSESISSQVPAIALRATLNLFGAAAPGSGIDVWASIRISSGNEFFRFAFREVVSVVSELSAQIDIPNVGQAFLYLWNTGTGSPALTAWVGGYEVPNGSH